jgi:hypothetical protein
MLFSTFLRNDAGRLTLSATGTYTVLVEGDLSETSPVAYSFNVAPIADSAQPLTLGTLANGTLAAPGQQDHFTFTLQADAQLYFDALTNLSGLQWSLSGPAGSVVTNLAFTISDGFGSETLKRADRPSVTNKTRVNAVNLAFRGRRAIATLEVSRKPKPNEPN